MTLLLLLAMENVFIVYGAWLESEFGLATATIGAVSVVISLAEMLAEGLSAGLVDRLGKRRAVLGGFVLLLLALLLLPRLSGALATALAGMALFIFAFEFTVVSFVPLISEVMPSARGPVLALNVAAMSVGRLVATLTAPRLWAAGGLSANALASGVMLAAGILILWRVVRER
ncbi:MAG: Sugar (and other) transporter [Chloroflexi bacterium ADurb.Bin325]|nr:MAG: Sugar (and other) transporter [Chloroflexi bacterium ADurb.Bin325]